jgi:hypothetical protein
MKRYPTLSPDEVITNHPNIFNPDLVQNEDGHDREPYEREPYEREPYDREPPYKDSPDHDRTPDFSRT